MHCSPFRHPGDLDRSRKGDRGIRDRKQEMMMMRDEAADSPGPKYAQPTIFPFRIQE